MATLTLSAVDQSLLQLVSTPNPSSIDEVITRMQAIDAVLPGSDGLKWFNRLYLMVTEQVDLHPPGGAWQNPVWLLRLDVVFAGFYFAALRQFLSQQTLPSAWNALFECRWNASIDRIQFALCGMNAHINRDLALALNQTNAELNVNPATGGTEAADYESVNTLLENVMPSALNMLAGDFLGELAQDSGQIGRILAFWDICRARDLAWDFAAHLRGLDPLSRGGAMAIQDAVTGALGRAILATV